MGKNEFLTPKAIANRIKAKGLQKLRWYCQMCQKQCRDENGFKCHCMSESHQRQMQVFGDNPDRFIDGYSEEFEQSFMDHMKMSHRSSRVAATVVYNEYIANRHHIHMNSTKWTTLTEFVKYLGRVGKCKVDETPKGWFMTFIDREPETLLKENLKNKRLKSRLHDEERQEKEIEDQIERAAKVAKIEDPLDGQNEKRPLQLEERTGEKVVFKMGFAAGFKASSASTSGKAISEAKKLSLFDMQEVSHGDKPQSRLDTNDSSSAESELTKKDTLQELMAEQERAKERSARKDYWLCEGIVVKVMSRSPAVKKYYNKKGTVRAVEAKYVGEIQMLESGDVLKVDQSELETVIPNLGGLVRIVNGAYRGSNARLLGIDTSKYSVTVQIEKGHYDGRVIPALEYEDICKIAS